MKKFLLASAVLMSFVACDGNKGKTPLSPDEQKVRMEEISDEFMTEFAATEFEDVMETMADLSLSCEETFANDYDWSELERIAEERLGEAISFEELDEYTSKWTYTLLFSMIKGEITLGRTAATYKEAENTVVKYVDDAGVTWAVEITPEGAVENMYLGEYIETAIEVGYDPMTGELTEERYYDTIYDITISVPERLVLSVKKGEENYLTCTGSFDFAFGNNGVDIEEDSVSISVTVEFAGVKAVVDRVACDAKSGKVETSAALYKDENLICSYKVSAEGNADFEEETWSAKNIQIEVDILGDMQIKGSCPNVNSIVDILDSSYPESEGDWERIINNINAKFDLNVYFDGGSLSQAMINLEARWNDGYGWFEPALEFNDGSRYLLDEYFTEDSFSGVIDDAESFVDEYEMLLERYFGSLL